MRPLSSLTLDALIDHLRGAWAPIPDERAAEDVLYGMADTLMSAFAMLFFQHPSLLHFQRVMQRSEERCNLQTIFQVRAVPSDTQMRTILDGVPTEPLRAVLPAWFAKLRRAGWAGQFKTELPITVPRTVPYTKTEAYYVMALDGTEYFHSTAIDCPSCLRQSTADGAMHYSHTVLCATLVKPGSHRIWPLDAEAVRNTDGPDKQDCELNAAKRLLPRVRAEHRQLPIVVSGDDLYSHEPFIADLKAVRMAFVLVAKPSSHKELFDWVEGFERQGLTERGQWTEGPACQRATYHYRFVRPVPLSGARQQWVTFVEVWQYDGQQVLRYHNSWVTDLPVEAANVRIVVAIGRARWKIENEHFNVHKNQGYTLEHNYGHGQKTLAMVFYLLNLLAFLAHILLDLGDRLYGQCRERFPRRHLGEILRVLMFVRLVENWSALLQACLGEAQARAP